MRITVVGGGRMGLPLAGAFCKRDTAVTVADIKPTLLRAIAAGECPYEEPSLASLMAELHAAQRLFATTDTVAAVSQSDGDDDMSTADFRLAHSVDAEFVVLNIAHIEFASPDLQPEAAAEAVADALHT